MFGTYMQSLPIDAHLGEVVDRLREAGRVVVEAPAGAGKTTRLPVALLRAGLAGQGRVLVLEPRRIAARMAAHRVAEQMGEALGDTVGYRIRFEAVGTSSTRLWYLTEGILSRMLASEPTLPDATVVVLDEFHERHLHSDLALAMCRALQLGARPDLRLVVMSATLDGAALSEQLAGAPVVRSYGRVHEVRIEHLARADARPTEVLMREALERLLAEGLTGHVLAFLPGAAEIRRAAQSCRAVAERAGIAIVPLHGGLPSAEQDRAVRPSERRKLVLATNVAETSITIDGVEAVVDSGLVRSAAVAPWSGLPVRRLGPICQASAEQRAGRAGRTCPGRCLRLYTRQQLLRWREHVEPEIVRSDLCELVLALRAAGQRDPRALAWLDPPPERSLESAERLLGLLGAIDSTGKLTGAGRELLAIPAHPRLGRLLLQARQLGVAEQAATVAALLGEREIARSRRVRLDLSAAGSDPPRGERSSSAASVVPGQWDLGRSLALYERACEVELDPGMLQALGLDRGATRAVQRAARAFRSRALGGKRPSERVDSAEAEKALRKCVLAAYPDRVARRVRPYELALAAGGAARLDPDSCVVEAALLVAVDAEERQERGKRQINVRSACAIEADWLLEMLPGEVTESSELEWHEDRRRVERVERLLFQNIILEELRDAAPSSPAASHRLLEAARAAGPAAWGDPEALEQWIRRVELVHRVQSLSEPWGDRRAGVDEALARLCEGRTSFAELSHQGLLDELARQLPPKSTKDLEIIAPEHILLPSGRRLRVHYEADRPPWVESRLQDFFGMGRGPTIGRGQVPLVLHLLAPNGRPVQVTRDLEGFWDRTYPGVRRELCRRYPKHAWPEDGRAASPPRPGRLR